MHGALCDDMGLGKTLQTLAVLQNEIYKQKQKNINTPSLILCPTTLCDHWMGEINKYVDTNKISAQIFK
jgi:TATA-binding protein-associated factor